MMKKNLRKGSALLIVLGMLSFMVVSAVSFSIFMRQSRAPSSYLRRNLAARYLVRAAVAKAIDALEGDFVQQGDTSWNCNRQSVENHFYGVFDDPYPGVSGDRNQGRQYDGNYWFRRVFTPFGLVESDYTVPTITLEGLAYLPPAIANDARALSRHTRTAVWQALPYNAGRYAYTIINVSDCFDVNKLHSGEARSSLSTCRISLGSMFLSDFNDPTSIDAGLANQLESELSTAVSVGNNIPIVSMGDYSIAMSETFSPFRRYLASTRTDFVAKGGSDNGMTGGLFITDTWFPATNSSTAVTLNLEDEGQPFGPSDLNSFTSYASVVSPILGKEGGRVLEANLGVGCVCLADYLDENDIPLSLALPTVEPVPMITGISQPAMLRPTVVTTELAPPIEIIKQVPDGEGGFKNVTVTRTFQQTMIDSLGPNSIMMSVVAAYPFKRMVTSQRAKRFTYRAVMKVFLVPDGFNRTRFPNDDLHLDKAKWDSFTGISSRDPEYNEPGVVTLYGTCSNPPQFNTADIMTSEQAVKDVSDNFTFRFEGANQVEMPLFCTVQDTCADYPTFSQGPVSTFAGLNRDANSVLMPVGTNGKTMRADDWFNGAWMSYDELVSPNTEFSAIQAAEIDWQETSKTIPYRICSAVWIQVLDEQRNVVDMVPAYCEDDADWRNYRGIGGMDDKLGADMPLMYFLSDTSFTLQNMAAALSGGGTVGFSWGSLYVTDPRYNFAPENWYAKSSSETEATKTTWLNDITSVMGVDGRDRDIFMFCSNQGYLQSIGELQFLPHLESLAIGNVSGAAGKIARGTYVPDFDGASFADRTAPGTGACSKYFWRTYTAYLNGTRSSEFGDDYTDPLYSLYYNGKYYSFVSGGATSFRVNPYSQDCRVIWSAIANTPFDYYVGAPSTSVLNENDKLKDYRKLPRTLDEITIDEAISQYTFNEGVACASMKKDEINHIANAFTDNFADGASSDDSDWVTTFDWDIDDNKSGWSGEIGEKGDAQMRFLETSLSAPLHGVDRKFLYSFWRECFANRQQLYLIFVNAEPAAVGGGGSGKNSVSQMGGRAVALVWRDPAQPSYNQSARQKREALRTSANNYRNNRSMVPPHNTRILFYHQFD